MLLSAEGPVERDAIWAAAAATALIDRGDWVYAPWLDKRHFVLHASQPFPLKPPPFAASRTGASSILSSHSWLGLPLTEHAAAQADTFQAKTDVTTVKVPGRHTPATALATLHILISSLLRARILDAFTVLMTPIRAEPRYPASLGIVRLRPGPAAQVQAQLQEALRGVAEPLPLARCPLNAFAALLSCAHSIALTEGTVLPVLVRQQASDGGAVDDDDEKDDETGVDTYEARRGEGDVNWDAADEEVYGFQSGEGAMSSKVWSQRSPSAGGREGGRARAEPSGLGRGTVLASSRVYDPSAF